MAETNKTGVFYFNAGPVAGSTVALSRFPRECRRTLASRFDSRFVGIFVVLLVLVSGFVWFFSHQKYATETTTTQQVQKIQERYAQLVLNQPKPKVQEPKLELAKPKTEDKAASSTATEKAAQETAVAEPEKETYVEKQVRRQATRETRAVAREQVKSQIQSAGIFAAITASSGGGSGPGNSAAADMLGSAADAVGDISNIKVTKGSFATRSVDAADLSARRGGGTSTAKEVGIARQEIGQASETRIASNAAVNISSSAADISVDESAGASPDRNAASIVRIISREKTRLIRVYENWLKRDPALAGQIRIKFTILANGSVTGVTVVKSTTNNTEFDQMIVRYVSRWMFPAIEESGAVVPVEFPLVFEGQGN